MPDKPYDQLSQPERLMELVTQAFPLVEEALDDPANKKPRLRQIVQQMRAEIERGLDPIRIVVHLEDGLVHEVSTDVPARYFVKDSTEPIDEDEEIDVPTTDEGMETVFRGRIFATHCHAGYVKEVHQVISKSWEEADPSGACPHCGSSGPLRHPPGCCAQDGHGG